MSSDAARTESFSKFVIEAEPRIRRAMTAALGVQAGRDATTDALVVAWKNWDRVSGMDNPVGYLYRVAVNEARRPKASDIAQDLSAATAGIPWIEPGLIPAVVELPERQRTIVSLLHAAVPRSHHKGRSAVKRHLRCSVRQEPRRRHACVP